MKISIIVPMYNSSNTILRLIQSIECQIYQNYELILVDDGSTDNTYEYVNGILKNKKNMYVYRKKNTGPGLTRKYGFEKSSGDLLFFVDSDDWITNEKVFKNIIDIFKNNDIDVLFFDREDVNNDKKDIVKGFRNIKNGVHNFDELDDIIRPGLGAKIFKKNKFSTTFFYDSNMYEDLYTTYMYLNKCKKFYYENKCFYTIYHDNKTQSITSSLSKDMYEKSLDILLLLHENIININLKKSLEYRMVYLFYIYLRNDNYHDEKILKKIKKIVKILSDNHIGYTPEYSTDKKILLKKIYIKIMIMFYKFKK